MGWKSQRRGSETCRDQTHGRRLVDTAVENSMTNARLNAVKALIDLSVPLEKLSGWLNQFEWDYDGEPVELRSDHAVGVLTSYVERTLSAKEVETWADLVESRE